MSCRSNCWGHCALQMVTRSTRSSAWRRGSVWAWRWRKKPAWDREAMDQRCWIWWNLWRPCAPPSSASWRGLSSSSARFHFALFRPWPRNPNSTRWAIAVRSRFLGAQRRYEPSLSLTRTALADARPITLYSPASRRQTRSLLSPARHRPAAAAVVAAVDGGPVP